jgi:hypothetical protein
MSQSQEVVATPVEAPVAAADIITTPCEATPPVADVALPIEPVMVEPAIVEPAEPVDVDPAAEPAELAVAVASVAEEASTSASIATTPTTLEAAPKAAEVADTIVDGPATAEGAEAEAPRASGGANDDEAPASQQQLQREADAAVEPPTKRARTECADHHTDAGADAPASSSSQTPEGQPSEAPLAAAA